MGDGMTSVSSSVSPVRLVAAVQRERPATEMLCHQVERGYGGSGLTTELMGERAPPLPVVQRLVGTHPKSGHFDTEDGKGVWSLSFDL